VVAIDEAQALEGSEALAELAALLNFEHDERRLLTAVLVGAPELEPALRDAGLLGRVELRVRLEALSAIEARAYLAHRIRVAGGEPAILAPEVMDAIAMRAAGLPRRMNALADNALFEAHVARRARVKLADVERAARDLPWAQGPASAASIGVSARPELDYAGALAGDPDEDALGGNRDAIARDSDRDELGLPELAGELGDLELDRVFADSAPPVRKPLRPLPPGVPELELTARSREVDFERLAAPERISRAASEAGELEPPVPDDKELDDLFVDLVEEA
jgi:hypothetical protein